MSSPLIYVAKQTILETERLLLRPLSVDDLSDYYEYVSDDELLQYDFPASKDLADALEALVAYNLAQPLGRYGLELKTSGKLIGHFSLRLNAEQMSVEVGYVLHRLYHRQGYAMEALAALLAFVQTIPQIETIVATVDHRNIASQHLLSKNNFQHVATAEQVESLRGMLTTNFIYERSCRTKQPSVPA